VLSSSPGRAGDEDVVGPLRESIAAAAVIVEGRAGQSYASWDGTDPATIRTYTPFSVVRVLKGAEPSAQILLQQRGGEVAGASAPLRGAEFSDGEEAIVFLGAQDPADGSYDVFTGRSGKFQVQRDEAGRAVLDVRLGADASAFGRAEKAPGTGLARVPAELFEHLASGAAPEGPVAAGATQPQQRGGGAPVREQNTGREPSAKAAGLLKSRVLIFAALAIAVLALVLTRLRRRRTRWT